MIIYHGVIINVVAYAVCATLFWIAFVYRLPDLRRDRRGPQLYTLLAALLLGGATFTMASLLFIGALDHLVNLPNLTALLTHVFSLAWNTATLALMAKWSQTPKRARLVARRWAIACGLAAIALVLLFIVSQVGGVSDHYMHHYIMQNANNPLGAAYLLIFVVALATAKVETIRICWPAAKIAKDAWLRRGLRTVVAGSAIFLIFCVSRAFDVIAVPLGVDRLKWEIIPMLSTVIGAVLLVAGLTMPSWGPKLSGCLTWMRDYSAYQRLRPLWIVLYRADPEIALEPPVPVIMDWVGTVDLKYRLYRRVIEIRDGLLKLHPYQEPYVVAAATEFGKNAGLSSNDLRAFVEAAQVKAALQVRARGGNPRSVFYPEMAGNLDGADITSETAWLLQVAREFIRSPEYANRADG